jgi:NADH:ubiquinone reductase (H+-translocating)
MPVSRSRALVALGLGLAGLYAARKLARPVRAPGLDEAPGSLDSGSSGGATIVILGAGFAGANAARKLTRLLPRERRMRVMLVDKHNFLIFTPMLTEVVSGEVDAHDIVIPSRRLSPHVTFIHAHVDAIDLAERTVTLSIGFQHVGIPVAQRTLHADHLVIALGSVTSFHGIQGLQEHAFTIKDVADADALYSRALALLERADAEPDPEMRRALLTFVVGGGGFSGVETMAALNDMLRSDIRYYPHIDPGDIHTVLVHHGDRLLPELGDKLARYAQRELERRGVEVMLHTGITEYTGDTVELQDGRRLRAHTLVWTGGVTPDPLVRDLKCKHGQHGGIATDSCFRVPGYPGVWAIGDCAEVPHPGSREIYAPTAQNATREGAHLARNILASLEGREPRPFVYRPIGELAIVGQRAGVASVYGLPFSGILAWAMWRAIYLAKEPSIPKRIRTGVDWLLDVAGAQHISQVPIGARVAPSRVTERPEQAASSA